MISVNQNPKNGFSVKAYQGDAKTLLAFNLPQAATANLAGFTIQYTAGGKGPYYLQNQLRFADPSQHVQDGAQPANSSLNAPIHKFRWLHVPGSVHQGTKPFFGPYSYTVTPRYFDKNESLQAIDRTLGATVTIDVGPFEHEKISLGFARGFMQSQAFVHHFGPKALKRPDGLLYDTSAKAGTNSNGEDYTYAQQYEWLGFTARTRVFEVVNEVLGDPSLTLDVFAYDLNEPDVCSLFLQLAAQGRMRMILDNASLHSTEYPTAADIKKARDAGKPAPEPKPSYEDLFEQAFKAKAKGDAAIKRGMFSRFAHDKELIVSKVAGGKKTAVKVLTGSTNFSVTGLYVNSNHVLVFDDPTIAASYLDVFDLAWAQNVNGPAFAKSPAAAKAIAFNSPGMPKIEVAYSPHPTPVAQSVLQTIVDRVKKEEDAERGSVFFAVMEMGKGSGPVFPALRDLHLDQSVFSYGITDTTDGIALYKPGTGDGLLVTGKPAGTKLPPPFDQVPGVGLGHQVHHKFVICGFNTPDAVVYCGSSNLALGGEQENGDNLIAIHDPEIATVFMIEALGLVDHFHFLDSVQTKTKASGAVPKKAAVDDVVAHTKSASKQHQAATAGWFLGTTDRWVAPYYDSKDLHCVDRALFGAAEAEGSVTTEAAAGLVKIAVAKTAKAGRAKPKPAKN